MCKKTEKKKRNKGVWLWLQSLLRMRMRNYKAHIRESEWEREREKGWKKHCKPYLFYVRHATSVLKKILGTWKCRRIRLLSRAVGDNFLFFFFNSLRLVHVWNILCTNNVVRIAFGKGQTNLYALIVWIYLEQRSVWPFSYERNVLLSLTNIAQGIRCFELCNSLYVNVK